MNHIGIGSLRLTSFLPEKATFMGAEMSSCGEICRMREVIDNLIQREPSLTTFRHREHKILMHGKNDVLATVMQTWIGGGPKERLREFFDSPKTKY